MGIKKNVVEGEEEQNWVSYLTIILKKKKKQEREGRKIHPKGNIRSAGDGYERENPKCEYECEIRIRKKKKER